MNSLFPQLGIEGAGGLRAKDLTFHSHVYFWLIKTSKSNQLIVVLVFHLLNSKIHDDVVVSKSLSPSNRPMEPYSDHNKPLNSTQKIQI